MDDMNKFRALIAPDPELARRIGIAPASRGVMPVGFPAQAEAADHRRPRLVLAVSRLKHGLHSRRSAAPAVADAERHVA